MKILLIYPYCIENRVQEDDINVIPIGVYYVGALLKKNHYDIEILNWYNINRKPEQIEKILFQKNPDIIGFSILHANRWGGIEIARIAKRINPDVRVVFGGIDATLLWKHFLTHFKEIDFVVMGEGEYTFLSLVKCLKEQDHKKIDKIKGLAFRKGDEICHTGVSERIKDLDELPVPADYFQYQHVSSTRGCPGNCTFCGSPEFWGHKVGFHSPEYFVQQLELLNKKGVSFFYFSDDIFAIKKARVIEICKNILKKNLNISWAAILRVDYADEDILYWMRKAGCIQISYGVESGSEQIRKILNKNIRTDQIKKAFALTTKYGILSRAYFIYGCPGESRATIQETIDLMHEIKPLAVIFYILDIFPGTSLCSNFMRTFKTTDDIWLKRIEDIMYHETDPHLTQDLILAFGERLRTEFYKGLPEFVDSLALIDKEDLYEMHSDFCSRLGMTFSHGDYAEIESIREKDKIAEKMYEKSLEYYPNPRAYLGLGIMRQKKGAHKEAVKILLEGIKFFPYSEQLKACLDVSRKFTK